MQNIDWQLEQEARDEMAWEGEMIAAEEARAEAATGSWMASYESVIVTDKYGAQESNPITDAIRETREAIDHSAPVDLTDSRLAKITRLRLVGDIGFPLYDLSYCYGELRDGTPVRVNLPWHQFSRRNLKRDLIEMCKTVRVYGKGLGIFDEEVVSICR